MVGQRLAKADVHFGHDLGQERLKVTAEMNKKGLGGTSNYN